MRKARTRIEPLVPKGDHRAFAVHFGRVVEKWCDARKPTCWECPLVGDCDFGKRVERDWKVQQKRLAAQRKKEAARLEAQRKKDEARRFEGVEWQTGATGAPLLADTLASLDCRVVSAHDAGDHVIYVGRVEAVRFGDAEPLVYYAGGYRALLDLPEALGRE